MATMKHGAQAPARWQLFACGLALLASCLLAASAGAFVSNLPSLFPAALTLDPEARLPAPTRYLYRGIHTTVMPGVESPLRTRLEARVPAEPRRRPHLLSRRASESSAGRKSPTAH